MNWRYISGFIFFACLITFIILLDNHYLSFPPDPQKGETVLLFIVLLFLFMGTGYVTFGIPLSNYFKEKSFNKRWK